MNDDFWSGFEKVAIKLDTIKKAISKRVVSGEESLAAAPGWRVQYLKRLDRKHMLDAAKKADKIPSKGTYAGLSKNNNYSKSELHKSVSDIQKHYPSKKG